MTNEQIREAYEAIEKVAQHFIRTTSHLSREYSVEDLTQEVYTHFLEKGFFEKFNQNITSFKYFVARAAKNHIIDIVRKGVDDSYSLDVQLVGKEGNETTTKKDMVEGHLVDQYSALLLQQMVNSCPDTRISPNYDLTWRRLLVYIMEGWTPSELHEVIGISSGRISQLKNELMDMLQKRALVQLAV